ncbi:hypothetical protein KI811_16195 [Geobacter hydrogenophilus]|uniref:Uncharacterized protein n=1 Tax=Geobacter hydrogenophilus TaxID=40983 RepID=A0A9W6G303_9BACT|nr:hypothetical protein [Geobacter hydrogenophilus]AJY68371.1 hypothetical protein RW64_01550 [Geobacter sulfurreducens]MBT0895349.1 hypothetical protein [Geobacter hydrogenophilus]GLI39576.1 hypothetical protein GHYDROH2_30770 [Geobacter hydrogenophilus]
MSTLANRTDKKFLLAALRAIRELDRANIGGITKEDDADMTAARNHLLAVIQSNGFQINYDTYRLTRDTSPAAVH